MYVCYVSHKHSDQSRKKIDLRSKFRFLNMRQAQSGICIKTLLIHDPLCFQNPPIRSIYHTNPQSVRFLTQIRRFENLFVTPFTSKLGPQVLPNNNISSKNGTINTDSSRPRS